MERNASISSFTQNTEYPITLLQQAPIIYTTSAVAKNSLSPIRENSKSKKCPDSAGSTDSLNDAFTGISMDSPLTEKHLLPYRVLPSSKLSFPLFDGKMENSTGPTPLEPIGIAERRPRGGTLFEDDLSPETKTFLACFSKNSSAWPPNKSGSLFDGKMGKSSEAASLAHIRIRDRKIVAPEVALEQEDSHIERRPRGGTLFEDDLSLETKTFLARFSKNASRLPPNKSGSLFDGKMGKSSEAASL